MKQLLTCLLVFMTLVSTRAQEFSLEQAVSFALKNHPEVLNGLVGKKDAELQIQEIKQTGLPQVNGNFSYSANLIVPTVVLPANTFNPMAPEGEIVKARFGVPWGGQAGIGVNQLIFDATWLVGLRAADTYRLLADQNLEQSKTTISENVQKAYYSVLVAQERSKLLELNMARLDSVLNTTSALFNQGFAEKIDLDRLSVQRNNLETEHQKVLNLIELSKDLLKFQMAYDQTKEIKLTDRLEDVVIEDIKAIMYAQVDPQNRIEYQLLDTQRRLTGLNMERFQKTAIPSVFFSGNIGASHGNPEFNPFERWFGTSAVTIGVNIPIYDSGLRKTRVERERLNQVKIDNGMSLLKASFDLQNEQAMTNLQNGIKTLDIQERNLELAKEIVRVSQIKYKEGVGSNLEIINAENDLKQAQTNYLAALYDLLVAKVDLDKAQGNLITE